MVITYTCINCGHEIVYHTDITRTKPPRKCSVCKGKQFKKE